MDMRATIDLTEAISNPSMLNVFKVLNAMVDEGAIGDYALCGAMAAFQYIEPFATQDLDITAKMVTSGILLNFTPITDFLTKHGLPTDWKDEGLMIAGYPVQFIPNSDPIDKEALSHAVTDSSNGVTYKVWAVEYLMVKCLQIGRPKDHNRLVTFLETNYDRGTFCNLVQRFGLTDRWAKFRMRFEIEDVCTTQNG